MKRNEACPAKIRLSNNLGMVYMEVIPTHAGIAELEIRYNNHQTILDLEPSKKSKLLEVRPSSALVRPLVLDTSFHPGAQRGNSLVSRRRNSRKRTESPVVSSRSSSRESTRTISI